MFVSVIKKKMVTNLWILMLHSHVAVAPNGRGIRHIGVVMKEKKQTAAHEVPRQTGADCLHLAASNYNANNCMEK